MGEPEHVRGEGCTRDLPVPGKASYCQDTICRSLVPSCPAASHFAARLLPAGLQYRGRGTRRQLWTSLNHQRMQDGAAERGLYFISGSCPQEARDQVVKHRKIYLRNEPPQLEIQRCLHTHREEMLPRTLLQINPLLGKSPDASCHVKTCWVHKHICFLDFSLFSLPSEFLAI